jgi:UDP-glucose 4-epimerase
MSGVLVTGATTPLGGGLVQALIADPTIDCVVAVGRERTPAWLPIDDRIIYLRSDLARPRSLRELLFGPACEHRIGAVIHTASHRSPRHRGRSIHQLNVESVRELIRLIDRHPTIDQLIYRSTGDVYRIDSNTPALIGEDDRLQLSPRAPQWLRDRVEADLTVCAQMGLASPRIAVLRLGELMAPDSGSQLWDYLSSRVCLRPIGFDPMINLLSLDDAIEALLAALTRRAQGVFNIPGADTLPLTEITRRWGKRDVPVPGPLLAPLYRLRARTVGSEFRYELNAGRFHFGRILDGRRAADELGYRPSHPIRWPDPDARALPRARYAGP